MDVIVAFFFLIWILSGCPVPSRSDSFGGTDDEVPSVGRLFIGLFIFFFGVSCLFRGKGLSQGCPLAL